jgi:hypothetical protein
LSRNPLHHPHHLIQAHPPSLDQTHDHAYMLYDRPAPFLDQSLLLFLDSTLILRLRQITIPVMPSLLVWMLAVVACRAARRCPLPVRLAAAKRTAQVIATRVTGMCQEEYPAVPASFQATNQWRISPNHRAQNSIICKNVLARFALAIPVRPKLKMSLDLYCKKPRLAPTILMGISMSSFYSINAFASSGRTGTPHLYRADGSVLLSRRGSIPVSAVAVIAG